MERLCDVVLYESTPSILLCLFVKTPPILCSRVVSQHLCWPQLQCEEMFVVVWTHLQKQVYADTTLFSTKCVSTSILHQTRPVYKQKVLEIYCTRRVTNITPYAESPNSLHQCGIVCLLHEVQSRRACCTIDVWNHWRHITASGRQVGPTSVNVASQLASWSWFRNTWYVTRFEWMLIVRSRLEI